MKSWYNKIFKMLNDLLMLFFLPVGKESEKSLIIREVVRVFGKKA